VPPDRDSWGFHHDDGDDIAGLVGEGNGLDQADNSRIHGSKPDDWRLQKRATTEGWLEGVRNSSLVKAKPLLVRSKRFDP
jgi:hypothetical protein